MNLIDSKHDLIQYKLSGNKYVTFEIIQYSKIKRNLCFFLSLVACELFYFGNSLHLKKIISNI